MRFENITNAYVSLAGRPSSYVERNPEASKGSTTSAAGG
jgi:hypothetical protein